MIYQANQRQNELKMNCVNTMELAMGYVPMQTFSNLYEPDKALREGTVFPELNKPFTGRRPN